MEVSQVISEQTQVPASLLGRASQPAAANHETALLSQDRFNISGQAIALRDHTARAKSKLLAELKFDQLGQEYAICQEHALGMGHTDVLHVPKHLRYYKAVKTVLDAPQFQRLAQRQQLYPTTFEGVHNRESHSLEVALANVLIAKRIGEDPLLFALSGLLHDNGHSPFGHESEGILNELMLDHGGFEGNAHNIKLYRELELPDEMVHAIVKYAWEFQPRAEKTDLSAHKGIYSDDLSYVNKGIPEEIRIRPGVSAKHSVTPMNIVVQGMDHADNASYATFGSDRWSLAQRDTDAQHNQHLVTRLSNVASKHPHELQDLGEAALQIYLKDYHLPEPNNEQYRNKTAKFAVIAHQQVRDILEKCVVGPAETYPERVYAYFDQTFERATRAIRKVPNHYPAAYPSEFRSDLLIDKPVRKELAVLKSLVKKYALTTNVLLNVRICAQKAVLYNIGKLRSVKTMRTARKNYTQPRLAVVENIIRSTHSESASHQDKLERERYVATQLYQKLSPLARDEFVASGNEFYPHWLIRLEED